MPRQKLNGESHHHFEEKKQPLYQSTRQAAAQSTDSVIPFILPLQRGIHLCSADFRAKFNQDFCMDANLLANMVLNVNGN